MKKERNPFLLIAMAAASNKGAVLSDKQCKQLMKNDYVFSDAVQAIPLKTWMEVLGNPDVGTMKHFKKLAELNGAK